MRLLSLIFSFVLLISGWVTCTINFLNDLADLSGSRSIILRLTRLGLANRLNALADWYIISRISSRVLVVSWEPTPDCNARFEELFQSCPQNVYLLRDSLLKDQLLFDTKIMAQNSSYANLDDEHARSFFFDDLGLLSSPVVNLYTSYDGSIVLKNMSCQHYFAMKHTFLQKIISIQAIKDIFHQVKSEFFNQHVMIGVHIRLHNQLYDWEVVPPSPMNPSKSTAFGEGATIDDFIEHMKNIQNHLYFEDSSGNRRNTVRFFVASNEERAKQRILRCGMQEWDESIYYVSFG